jgi:tetratricopeptide (TPR) repeat protein
MNHRHQDASSPGRSKNLRSPVVWFVTAGCLVSLLIILLRSRNGERANPAADQAAGETPRAAQAPAGISRDPYFAKAGAGRAAAQPARTAEEIVAGKFAEFARGRRNLARALAEKFQTQFPDEFERFFAAAEAGRREEMNEIYNFLKKQRDNGAVPWYGPAWRTLMETVGVAEAVHDWPAQKLLDYGNTILDALRPGMIYVGGTDAGCFIPTLLNETSGGERHVVLTQNGLADGTYVDYLGQLYGDRLKPLTQDDSTRAFQDYMTDVQRRFEHDQKFPDEPKQLLPGENVGFKDGRIQVSGQAAVMAINERLFKSLMQNNPEAAFAMEESFPFKSLYAQALPLGPVMELGVKDDQNTLTPARAGQVVDYWRSAAQQLAADPQSPAGSDSREAYSKLVVAHADLLLARNFSAEAEQAFRIASEISPANPEMVHRYIELLTAQNRFSDALNVLQKAMEAAPTDTGFANLARELQRQRKP